MEHHAQSIDDALIGGLSYKLKPGASYVSNRRSCTYHSSGGNQFASSGVRVMRFNIVSDEWLDPSTFRVLFQLNNLEDPFSAKRIQPLHWNPAVFFRRARLICGGVVLEDIDDFNRLSLMLTALKSIDDQKEIAMEGFGCFTTVHDSNSGGLAADPDGTAEDADGRKSYRIKDWDEADRVLTSRKVLFKPMLGLFNQDKVIPLRFAPLQIELELVNNSADAVFVGAQDSATMTANWSISEIQCKVDLLTLDSSLQNEYASHLLGGKSLPINFSTFNHSNQSTGNDKDFNTNIHRSLTRLKAVFVTLFKNGAMGTMPEGHRKICNDFYHPCSGMLGTEDLETGNHQFWIQLGSKLSPEYPITSGNEAYYHLRKAVGHPINIYARWYHTTKYIIGIDMEKISGAGFTGQSTKAGEILTLNFRDCINGSTTSTIPERVYCALHYDCVLNIKDSGVELLE